MACLAPHEQKRSLLHLPFCVQVRYMESFEARHSNHDMALAIAGGRTASLCALGRTCMPRVHWRGCRCVCPQATACWFTVHQAITSLLLLPSPRADEIGITLPSLRLDSQAKYGALSRGDASVFMRFPDPSYREKIWDHCAGVIILQVRGALPAARQPLLLGWLALAALLSGRSAWAALSVSEWIPRHGLSPLPPSCHPKP